MGQSKQQVNSMRPFHRGEPAVATATAAAVWLHVIDASGSMFASIPDRGPRQRTRGRAPSNQPALRRAAPHAYHTSHGRVLLRTAHAGRRALGTPDLAFHARLIELALQVGNAGVPQVHGRGNAAVRQTKHCKVHGTLSRAMTGRLTSTARHTTFFVIRSRSAA
jgi:hypothetical protein